MPHNPNRLIRQRPGTIVGIFVPLSEEEAEDLIQPEDEYVEYDEPVDDYEEDEEDDYEEDVWDDE